jgi:hypothetical protein
MNKRNLKQIHLFVFIFLLNIPYSFSQDTASTCKVLLKEISGEYKGTCKNGLADGKGTATGEDSYTGTFKNGLPDGKGVYKYKNGSTYTGYWKDGLRNGKGKFKQLLNGKNIIVSGYWKDGIYSGITPPDEEYRINRQTGIAYYLIKRTDNNINSIVISFEKTNLKYVPKDLSIELSGGYLVEQNKAVGVMGYDCPVQCSLHYTVPTLTGLRECFFTITILKSGKFEICLSSD